MIRTTIIAILMLSSSAGADALKDANAGLDNLAAGGFQGSVLVACGKDTVLRRDVGLPAHDDTATVRYEVASISKWLTAIATLKLVEQGHLGLDASLSKFFPAVPADKADITVRQLLTHQSGLPQAYAAEGHADMADAAAAIFAGPLDFPPGTGFGYANDNFSLLAMLIEKASGMPYRASLQQTIADPLGMDPVAFWPDPIRPDEYFPPLLSPRETPPYRQDWGFMGGHGARLSVAELHKILMGIEDGTLLTPASRALLFGPHLTTEGGTGIGMGWYHNRDDAGRALQSTRGSDNSGGNAVVYKVGTDGLVVIAATNAGPDEDAGPGWSRQARDVLIAAFAASPGHPDYCASAGTRR
ncbi:MAG: class A beta-lactamase-related serine hydrolase [Alphaproteobacteria bacterium]|nr:MAG: class A beta-lactamase-related serine hydrolase [Alphaproteobacteria bacterium]